MWKVSKFWSLERFFNANSAIVFRKFSYLDDKDIQYQKKYEKQN